MKVYKEKIGVVVSNKMTKTLVVQVEKTYKHPKYGKFIKKSKHFYAHDESQTAVIGNKVKIVETRPISRLKRWRLVEILTPQK